jgi:hypothetical protein
VPLALPVPSVYQAQSTIALAKPVAHSLPVSLVSATPPITGTISGTVFYGRAPQAGIKVELLKDAKDPKSGVATATTDSQGQFQLTKVPQGKYHVQAQGVVRNKRREAGADVAVDKTLELNHVLNLELP